MIYFGSKISPNIVFKNGKDSTGGIICIGVPLARTGYQEYGGNELDEETRSQFNIKPSDKVKVYRSPEEVFRRETLASFEGDPVTDQHPPERKMVTAEKYKELTCGHAQNIREGEKLASGERVMIGDLHIYDANLIDKVLNKLQREISCGYNYRFQQMPEGSLAQIDISGNHIAVVPSGRAGSEVYIHDSAPEEEEETRMAGESEKKTTVAAATGLKGIVARMLQGFSQHSTADEFAEATQAMSPLLAAQDAGDGKESSMAGENKDTTTGRLSEEGLLARATALDQRAAALDARSLALDARAKDDDDKMHGKDDDDDKRAHDDDDEHPAGCRCDAKKCMDARKGKDSKKGRDDDKRAKDDKKRAKDDDDDDDKRGKDKKRAKDADKDEDEIEKVGDDDKDDDKDDKDKDEKEGADSDIEPVEVLPPKDRGENPITASDSAMVAWGQTLREWRKSVARNGSKEERERFNVALDSFNEARKGKRGGKSESGYDAFTDLKRKEQPRNINEVKPDAYNEWAGKDPAVVRAERAAKGGK